MAGERLENLGSKDKENLMVGDSQKKLMMPRSRSKFYRDELTNFGGPC